MALADNEMIPLEFVIADELNRAYQEGYDDPALVRVTMGLADILERRVPGFDRKSFMDVAGAGGLAVAKWVREIQRDRADYPEIVQAAPTVANVLPSKPELPEPSDDMPAADVSAIKASISSTLIAG